MNKTIIIGAGALGVLVVLEQLGRKAGAANTAAASSLAQKTIAGATFSVPASSSMVATWRAMRAALGSRTLSVAELRDVCDAWLDAYKAGCEATAGNVVTGDLYNESAYNYALVRDPAGVMPGNCSLNGCKAEWASLRTPLGNAVCAVKQDRDALAFLYSGFVPAGTQQGIYDHTLELARAMDAADYVRDGQRASDSLPGVADLPGMLLDGVVGDIITSPIVAVAVLGFVAWKVLA